MELTFPVSAPFRFKRDTMPEIHHIFLDGHKIGYFQTTKPYAAILAVVDPAKQLGFRYIEIQTNAKNLDQSKTKLVTDFPLHSSQYLFYHLP